MPKRSRSSAGLHSAWPTDPREARRLAREQDASIARLAAHGSNAQAEAQAEAQALVDEKKAHTDTQALIDEKKAHEDTQSKLTHARDTIAELGKMAQTAYNISAKLKASVSARSIAGACGGGGGVVNWEAFMQAAAPEEMEGIIEKAKECALGKASCCLFEDKDGKLKHQQDKIEHQKTTIEKLQAKIKVRVDLKADIEALEAKVKAMQADAQTMTSMTSMILKAAAGGAGK